MAPTDRIPEWINLVTGWDTTHEDLQLVGERIANLRLAFSLKHGNNPAARAMPGRMRGDPPQHVGPHEGGPCLKCTESARHLGQPRDF